jgi:hypothetical protein
VRCKLTGKHHTKVSCVVSAGSHARATLYATVSAAGRPIAQARHRTASGRTTFSFTLGRKAAAAVGRLRVLVLVLPDHDAALVMRGKVGV